MTWCGSRICQQDQCDEGWGDINGCRHQEVFSRTDILGGAGCSCAADCGRAGAVRVVGASWVPHPGRVNEFPLEMGGIRKMLILLTFY